MSQIHDATSVISRTYLVARQSRNRDCQRVGCDVISSGNYEHVLCRNREYKSRVALQQNLVISNRVKATWIIAITFKLHTQYLPFTYKPAIMSDPSKDQTSTLQSYVDSATGAVQSALGSLTGSTADKVCLSYIPSDLTCSCTDCPRHKARTAKPPQTSNTISPTQPPKPVPSRSHRQVVSQRTTQTAPLARGTRMLAQPKRQSAASSALRA